MPVRRNLGGPQAGRAEEPVETVVFEGQLGSLAGEKDARGAHGPLVRSRGRERGRKTWPIPKGGIPSRARRSGVPTKVWTRSCLGNVRSVTSGGPPIRCVRTVATIGVDKFGPSRKSSGFAGSATGLRAWLDILFDGVFRTGGKPILNSQR